MTYRSCESDREYPLESEQIHQGAVADAYRNAVLWPIVRTHPLGRNRPALPEAYRLLQELWRTRVDVLAGAGWRATKRTSNAPGRNYACLRNCPPFTAEVPRAVKGNSCNRARVCPMCYGRRCVAEVYKALEWAFYRGEQRPVFVGHRVVAIRHCYTGSSQDHTVADWSQGATDHRQAELRAFPMAVGAAVVTTVEPGRRPAELRMCRTTLMILPAAGEPVRLTPPESASRVSVRECQRVTKGNLSRLVAWSCAFPLGMMFGGARMAAEILNVTQASRLKMLSTSGLIRCKAARLAGRCTEAGSAEDQESSVGRPQRGDGLDQQ